MLDLLFANKLYPTGLEFNRVEGYPDAKGCILMVPGRYWHERMPEIQDAIRRYKWLLFVRTGDEEDLFDIKQLEHPNCRWWVQTPRTDRDYGDARLFGVGFSPAFVDLPEDPRTPEIDVFLSAQNNHARRHAFFDALRPWRRDGQKWVVSPTAGFTQGLAPVDYAEHMMHSRVALAPAGPVTPDSFRVYEALEAHAVPLADDITSLYDSAGYWRTIFPDAPFPILANLDDLVGWINDQLAAWPKNANRIAAYWMRYKRKWALDLVEELKILGAL